MTRLTFAGAIFLTIIAILPEMLSERLNVPYITAQFFGGTSLLIVVGVVLDTMRQIETHLIQRHYDGFLRKGRIRGRFDRTPTARGEAVQQGALIWLYVGIAHPARGGNGHLCCRPVSLVKRRHRFARTSGIRKGHAGGDDPCEIRIPDGLSGQHVARRKSRPAPTSESRRTN